jgi:hypothetical protein
MPLLNWPENPVIPIKNRRLPTSPQLQRSFAFKVVHELGDEPDIKLFEEDEAAMRWDGDVVTSLRLDGYKRNGPGTSIVEGGCRCIGDDTQR